MKKIPVVLKGLRPSPELHFSTDNATNLIIGKMVPMVTDYGIVYRTKHGKEI